MPVPTAVHTATELLRASSFAAWQDGDAQPDTPADGGVDETSEADSAPAEPETPEAGALEEVGAAGEGLIAAVSDGDWQGALEQSQGLVVAAIPVVTNIVVAVLILIVAIIVSKRARRIVEKTAQRSKIDVTLSKFFGQVARWAILILGIIIAIGKVGIPTASFVAVIGGASLAIGLAFQGSLGNLAAGVMLLVFRPFKVGDVVQVGGVTAKVTELDLFTTLLDTFDNRRIIMPNGNIFGSEIENITHHPTRRVDVAVGTEYPADIDQTRQVLEGVASAVQGALRDPAPVVYLNQLGGSSIDWAVRVWAKTEDYWAVRERLTRDIKYALDGADIGIPFPQMDVHIDGVVKQG